MALEYVLGKYQRDILSMLVTFITLKSHLNNMSLEDVLQCEPVLPVVHSTDQCGRHLTLRNVTSTIKSMLGKLLAVNWLSRTRERPGYSSVISHRYVYYVADLLLEKQDCMFAIMI